MLILYLIGEEGGDNGKQSGNELLIANDMASDGRNGEELQSEIFDRCFRFTIHKEIGIDDAGIDTGKMTCCE